MSLFNHYNRCLNPNYHLNEMQKSLYAAQGQKKCIGVYLSLLISYYKLHVPQSHNKDIMSDILVGRIIKSNSSNPHCNYSNFTILLNIGVAELILYLIIPTEENNT